jgi:tripartite-type tricarboxylate transporter receptor subunit TctC
MPFIFSVWQGFYVPTGTPAAIVQTLSRAIEQAVQNESVQKQLAGYGVMPIAGTYRSPQAHKQRLEEEIVIWTELYRDSPKQ